MCVRVIVGQNSDIFRHSVVHLLDCDGGQWLFSPPSRIPGYS